MYIYWCVAFIWLFGQNTLPMFLTQCVVGASAVFPAYVIGSRMFDTNVGLLFSSLCALYPEMVFLSTRATPEFAYVLFALLAFGLYLRLKVESEKTRHSIPVTIQLGTVIGIGILIREGILLIAAGLMFGVLHAKGMSWNVWKRHIIPVAAIAILIVIPWIVRNSIVQKQFIPLRTALGMNLWMGNHAEATGSDRTLDGGYQASYLMDKNREYYAQNMPLDEPGSDRFMMHEAMRYIKAHPEHYLQLSAKRLWYFVWFTPNHALASNLIYRISWIAVLIAGLTGFIIAQNVHKLDPAIPMTILLFALLYVPVIVLPRYRIIPVSLMLLFASLSLRQLLMLWVRLRGFIDFRTNKF
jgi:4-amino-4-deoxy-L-arabinose transferase-like glycosyltransferase